ncbi:YicC/YloC family endoribonuclease [Geoalkalibacter halelectricus]|uniref:YicC family protein n=1 Tax=Geoalkalibacter halelectricus TaxID=2847045 RepID=A0ABY5ZIA6_9BACT|nr:YicC/YloC family endoribonuclease [Geoalkalibacter halelectricus]MDO3376595.1 YicC family protein [Geoalkalibacter halelectricus]UWZ78446.1 YicC family protein [Geoalkalibacter halelectricus]
MKSMTGYGKGQARVGGLALTAEIKTVNHRFGDINIKAPRFLLSFDNEIKKRVGERLRRGKIDVYISQEVSESLTTVPVLNRPLAESYMDLFRKMEAWFDLRDGVPLSLLAQQRDVILMQEAAPDPEGSSQCLFAALDQALAEVERMRAVEGQATREDMETRLRLVEQLLEQIKERAPLVVEEWRQKLHQRLERLSGELEVDPQRVAQEVALFADRCDISEEVARFASHLNQFRDLLGKDEPVGRQLDFLAQELNRETNTMGSKSNDAELTRMVVQVKAELEKIREQVQNVE